MVNSRRVVVVGAGGHAHVVVDVLLATDNTVVAALDRNPDLSGRKIRGVVVANDDRSVSDMDHDAVIVAVGDNEARRHLFSALAEAGETFVTAVHPSAVIAPDVILGDGVLVCAGAVINPAAIVAENSIVNTSASVDHHCQIGPHVHIAPGARLGGECVIAEGVLVGIGATLLPRVRVGRNATIGGGAVVTTDVEEDSVVAGNPARPISRREGEGS